MSSKSGQLTQVDILMPCRNVSRWVDAAVLSLLSQSFSRWRLLAWDDGSIDDTYSHLKFWAEQDERISVARPHEVGVGYIHLLNEMMTSVRAPLVARQDADDLSTPGRLFAQVRYLEHHSNVVLVGTKGHNIDSRNGDRFFEYRWERDVVNSCCGEDLSQLMRSEHRVIHGAMMIRSEVLREIGGWDEALAPVEDWDLCLRASAVGEVHNVPVVGYIRRFHGENVSDGHPNKAAALAEIVRRHGLEDFRHRSYRTEVP